jgi:hypothetical protein
VASEIQVSAASTFRSDILAEPAQHQDRLVSGRGGAGADAGAPAQSFGDQQLGQQRGRFGGHVEQGQRKVVRQPIDLRRFWRSEAAIRRGIWPSRRHTPRRIALTWAGVECSRCR